MRWIWVLAALCLAGAINADDAQELPLADACDPTACLPPNCRCSSTDIPGGLRARDIPQFVLLTFDDEINSMNIETYRNNLYGRVNSNGCPATATFFIRHEFNVYTYVNELYNHGYKISLQSITHNSDRAYWYEASYETLVKEFAEQRTQIAHFANIPFDDIKGMRIPFQELSGNNSFQLIADYDLMYDSSWPTATILDPGLWPYTLDYASTQDCARTCPTASFPGVWVVPMVSWEDELGVPCSMLDYCIWLPDRTDEDAWFKFIMSNFERHYFGNRVPFGLYLHEWFITAFPAVGRAVYRFLDVINNVQDIFMVDFEDVIDWVKNPVTINEYREQPCKTFTPTTCPASRCGPLTAEHNNVDYWLDVCNVCPRTYPWLGNPLGQ